MANSIEQLSVKELIEKQGLTVHQLRITLQRLEKTGYGSLPIVLASDDEMNNLRPILDTQDATVMTCSDRELHGLGAYVVIG